MLIKLTRILLLSCTVAVAVYPAAAKPARTPGKTIQNKLDLTDVSAARRHRHVARRHLRRVQVRHSRLRPRGTAQVAAAPAIDIFGVGYQSATSPQYADQRMPRAPRRERSPRTHLARAPQAQVNPGVPSGPVFGSGLVAEARRYIGANPTGRSNLWCGHFMNLVLKRSGREINNLNTARSFASYGQRVSGPQIGAIAVMSRGRRGGHVGVVSGIDANGNPIIISGNHGGRVAESVYPRGRIYAYVMP